MSDVIDVVLFDPGFIDDPRSFRDDLVNPFAMPY
jgi:hypothetical protein